MLSQSLMNPCPNCGSERDLGTWKCRACGQSLGFDRQVEAEMMKQRTLERQYDDYLQYQRDARILGKDGWRMTSVRRPNDFRWAGSPARMLFALILRPKNPFFVTYTRDLPGPDEER